MIETQSVSTPTSACSHYPWIKAIPSKQKVSWILKESNTFSFEVPPGYFQLVWNLAASLLLSAELISTAY